MKNTKGRIRTALFAAALLAAGAAQADAVTDNARALLDKGDAKSAFALLEPLEPQRAGDPEYDFLLGLAALEVGKNTNAVFALERVLAVDPNHVRARAEIARAYLALGETKTAKQESPQQPTIAQTPTPVPNRQQRTTERPDVKTQADAVTPSNTAGRPSATDTALAPASTSQQRATATVTAPRATQLPSAEPNTPNTSQSASRITRTTGQSSPTTTANPTQAPTLTRNTNNAPSTPSATRVATAAAAPTQVANSGELSPSSTATQRTTTSSS